ncbi:MAG: VCBS repeat-containing protein [Verrucomicrobia bacterium]|nr:VCBS repeat-containing protein [Verrucomicrobiota bacterium]
MIPILSTLALLAAAWGAGAADVSWQRHSSATGDLPPPNPGSQQTCLVVADFNKDGLDDFAIGERTRTPSVVWYAWNGRSWTRRIIDAGALKPEAGGDVCDIDADGDLDLILGQDASGSAIWWWENPHPDFSKPWMRRFIKNTGGRKHHDQSVADYDGDGQPELVSWNQGAKQLLYYEIPARPKAVETWTPAVIYSWRSGQELEGFPSLPTDIDGDGKVDVVGGGRWFKHRGGTRFDATVVDDSMRFTQCAAGQLVKGGWAELVFSPGDMDGKAAWYEWDGRPWLGRWVAHELRHVTHGHTCEVRDIDADGNLDILIGEMGDPGAGDEAQTFVWFGDGKGHFRETVVSAGQGIHEGRLGDVNGDRRLDILMKPYHHKAPRMDVLLNLPTTDRSNDP